MPINAHPDFLVAEKEYHKSNTIEEKLSALKKMISTAPSHKGGENLRQQLTTRRKKIEQQIKKSKTKKTSKSIGIKKQDVQAIIIGFANSGKSSLLSLLTNVSPKISEHKFTTKKPIIGMMNYADIQIQLIENPAIKSEYYDRGIIHTTDTILIVVDKIEQIEKILSNLKNSRAKKIIIFNKRDLRSERDNRKIFATLQSKKYNFVLVSTKTKQGIEELKEKLFQSFEKIRVYTKEPGKEKSKNPIILSPNSNIKDVSEKILKGFSKNVREIKLWGPSSKFPGQKVGLKHKLKDLDVVEFKTR